MHLLSVAHQLPKLLLMGDYPTRLLVIDEVTGFAAEERVTSPLERSVLAQRDSRLADVTSNRYVPRALILLCSVAASHHILCVGTRPRLRFPLRAENAWVASIGYHLEVMPLNNTSDVRLAGIVFHGMNFPQQFRNQHFSAMFDQLKQQQSDEQTAKLFIADFSVTDAKQAAYALGRWGPPSTFGVEIEQRDEVQGRVRHMFATSSGGLIFREAV